MSNSPGQPLPMRLAQLDRFVRPVVYGFPLGESDREILAKLPPLPEISEGDNDKGASKKRLRIAKHSSANFRRLEALCMCVWPKGDIRVKMVRSPVGEAMVALALVACTSVNNELLPQSDVLERLADVMAKEGFEEKPKWFYLYQY